MLQSVGGLVGQRVELAQKFGDYLDVTVTVAVEQGRVDHDRGGDDLHGLAGAVARPVQHRLPAGNPRRQRGQPLHNAPAFRDLFRDAHRSTTSPSTRPADNAAAVTVALPAGRSSPRTSDTYL